MLLVTCVYHFDRKKKFSQVGKFIEIIQPFSEATTGGVPERKPLSNNIVES